MAYACYLNGQGAALRWQAGKTVRTLLDKATFWKLTQAAQDIVTRAQQTKLKVRWASFKAT